MSYQLSKIWHVIVQELDGDDGILDVSKTPVDAHVAAAAFLIRSSDKYAGGPT
jgi:hypothetical protein